MDKPQFTKNQLDAINIRGRNILVSAAAGSGKTAVLTERVIKMLTEENYILADKLIVVTYTVAAANELSERIYNKLWELINDNPENELYSKQLMLLSKAKICTIHSLCSSLIKNNYYQLGLQGNYKLAEENELNILNQEVITQIFEEKYDKDDKDFFDLIEFVCNEDDKELSKLILLIYDYIRSFKQPFLWLDNALSTYTNVNCVTDYQYYQVLKDKMISLIIFAYKNITKALKLIKSNEKTMKAYYDAFIMDKKLLKRLFLDLSKDNWDECYNTLVNHSKSRLNSIRNFDDKSYLEAIQGLREKAYKAINTLKEKYLNVSSFLFVEEVNIMGKHIATLFSMVKEFYNSISAAKLNDNILDYSDLQHFSLKLLTKTNDENELVKSDFAISFSSDIEEILVDECQDINEVQETIFKMISQDENNIFMVGDVKQSIYKFQKAMPSIFINKREKTPLLDDNNRNLYSPITILLKDNFRSRKSVTESVNFLFSQIMSHNIGEIDYNEQEQLNPKANYTKYSKDSTAIHFVPYVKQDKKSSRTAVDADYVASLINKMVNDKHQVTDKKTNELRDCKYSDFAILLRSVSKKSEIYIKALKKYKIGAFCNTSVGFFNTNEINIILSFLKILDNPLKDMHLVTALSSSIFMFTPDDLIKLRLYDKKGYLYNNLVNIANAGDEKFSKAVSIIKDYRFISNYLPIDELLFLIYNRTNFLAICQASLFGEQKGNNLKLLIEYARNYDAVSINGLSGFLRYIDKSIEQEKDFESFNTISQSEDVVKIVTIHSTKGLEYPICILADCASEFNLMDIKNKHILNTTYGFSIKYKNQDRYVEHFNPITNMVKDKAISETISEEQRLLYVALTRAREKLIMVITCKNPVDFIKNHAENIAKAKLKLDEKITSAATSYADWIVMAYLRHSDFITDDILPNIMINKLKADFNINVFISNESEEYDEDTTLSDDDNLMFDELITKKCIDNFNFLYSYNKLTQVPAKMTITTIAKQEQNQSLELIKQPNFLNDGLDGAQKGTILHNFMQYADFNNLNEDLEQEIKRLVDGKFLNNTQIEHLDREKIKCFKNSNLFKRIINSQKVYKEYDFIFFIPAAEYDGLLNEFDENIILQGIADCIFTEGDELVIVDYKTDNVKTENTLKDRYVKQLFYYKKAIERIFNKSVKECIIYSTSLNKEIYL